MEEHPQARSIIQTLNQAGFIAYYAGGWVRDFLLKHPSDDIDIATNAPPETIQALFPRTVPIGISFGIVLVIIDHHQYEVATFRRDLDYHDGRRPSKIIFSSAEEDAKRRDFTINGMFYDPILEKVLDYVEGQEDLEKKIIRAIGNPHERIKEDRLRMMRALRLSCRFGFSIEENTKLAIISHANELFPAVAIERIIQELNKAKAFHKLLPMLLLLHEYHLLGSIFPALANLSLDTLKERIEPAKNYPQDAPTIAFLLALFPDFLLDDALQLCKQLKLSNQDLTFVSSLFACASTCLEDHLNPGSVDLWKWAHLYANEYSHLIFPILFAQQKASEKKHTTLQKRLKKFILRIQEKDPIIQSKDLLKEHILPGKKMGKLLLEAEKISINEEIEEKEKLLDRLKKSPIWKENG